MMALPACLGEIEGAIERRVRAAREGGRWPNPKAKHT
jgi:hypothetical protein